MGMVLAQFQTVNQPSELTLSDPQYFCPGFRPSEILFLQSFVPQTESVSVPIQNLDDISSAVAEYKQMPGKRIKLHIFLNDNGQAVYGFAHIRVTEGQIDLHSR
jgi:hypothetical protein